MDKEEVLSYFTDESNPVGLLNYRWYDLYDYSLGTIRNINGKTEIISIREYDCHGQRRNEKYEINPETKISLNEICSWGIGSHILRQDRLYNKGVYPREAVIYGDVKEAVNARSDKNITSIKTNDILTNGNDEEAGFLAYIYSANYDDKRGGEAIYTFIAPSEKIDIFAKHVKEDPRLVHDVLSNIEPVWIKGLKRRDYSCTKEINGKIFISSYDKWQEYLQIFGASFWGIDKYQDLLVKCINEGTQTYELEEEIKEIFEKSWTYEEYKEHQELIEHP
ncbi:MAG: hypothetical protein KJ906_02335 [Nanoarchaeota archaeon]|nr:hypothetical protein [Nanoarchaeota archaeon]